MPDTKTCTKCGESKPLTEYHRDVGRPDGLKCYCRSCVLAVVRRWREENPERAREYGRQWRQENPERTRERARGYARQRYQENPERVREKSRQWYQENRERVRARRRENPERERRQRRANLERERRQREENRTTVFEHYGQVCACCRSTELLQMDHVDGNGQADRAAGRRGSALYRWLISQRFPPGFQTLCRPCNRSKGIGPRCKLDHTAVKAA